MEGGADDDFAAGKKERRSKADFETQNNNPEASGFGVERKNETTLSPQTTNPKPSASDLKGGANGAERIPPPKHKSEAYGFGFERKNKCNEMNVARLRRAT